MKIENVKERSANYTLHTLFVLRILNQLKFLCFNLFAHILKCINMLKF